MDEVWPGREQSFQGRPTGTATLRALRVHAVAPPAHLHVLPGQRRVRDHDSQRVVVLVVGHVPAGPRGGAGGG